MGGAGHKAVGRGLAKGSQKVGGGSVTGNRGAERGDRPMMSTSWVIVKSYLDGQLQHEIVELQGVESELKEDKAKATHVLLPASPSTQLTPAQGLPPDPTLPTCCSKVIMMMEDRG